MSREPRAELEAGIAILDSVLIPHGFVFEFQSEGIGSGGHFAWGKYVHADRSLHLHHRWGLGIVEYHIAHEWSAYLSSMGVNRQVSGLWIDHDAYMTSMGVHRQSDYLWLPLDAGVERYRGLRSDLERFCFDFLTGPAIDWKAAATQAGQRRAEKRGSTM